MGGAVTVPGNVEASPAAEWNIYIDPEAGRRVIAAGVAVLFVPLDATNYLPWTDRLLTRVAALGTPAADTVHQLAKARDTIEGIYLWDELAAMVAVVPDLVTVEAMTVRIDDDGAVVRDPDGFPVEVAVSADTDAATQEFLDTLNGSPVSPAVPLTPAELEYFVTMGGADSNASASFSRLYGGFGTTEVDPRTQAAAFINGFLDSIAVLASELRKVSPPAALVSAHDGYVESLTNLASVRSDLLARIAASDGLTLDEIFSEIETSVTDPFDRVGAACQILVDYSFLHDGPRPCSFE